MKGFSQVFAFTCKQIADKKNYKNWTIILALLLFLLPAVLLPLAERGREDPGAQEVPAPGSSYEGPDYLARVKAVFYAAETDDGYAWDSLALFDEAREYRLCESRAEALLQAKEYGEGACCLLIRKVQDAYTVSALVPDEAEEEAVDTALAAAANVAARIPACLLHEMGASEKKMQALSVPIGIVAPEGEGASDPTSVMKEIAGFALPYVNIMLIYFLVLFYGNTVANHVILEKTSKLMDTFLLSVKPKAMIMGKVMAAWCTSLLQLSLWIAALVCGCSLGAHLARSIHPGSTMGILRFFDFLGTVMSFYSPVRIIIALLIIAAGFLLYCSLAGLAGSFASKPEELAASMQIFQLVLIASYLVVLLTSLRNISSASTGIEWYDFVPFTAMMVTPVRLLMGVVPVWAGLVCLLLTAGLALLVTYLAGKVYSMMSLYKGNVPRINEMLKIIFSKA